MTGRDSRLDKLERPPHGEGAGATGAALLEEGKDEEPSWRWAMPVDQVAEFNRLIRLMNGVNERLLPFILVVGLEVDKLHLRLGWGSSSAGWRRLACGFWLRLGRQLMDEVSVVLKNQGGVQ